MNNRTIDKLIERERYDKRSSEALAEINNFEFAYGASSMPYFLRPPYLLFEQYIKDFIKPCHKVLELGSGSGMHTRALLETGAEVTATDIAPSALELLRSGLIEFGDKLKTQVADMESLPFGSGEFDFVVSAGSLSYGDLQLVTSEIKNVLNDFGIFICVDSFNHNPVYRLNRYIHYLKGNRSKSTLARIPDEHTINFFRTNFTDLTVNYFGIFIFFGGVLSKLFGAQKAGQMIDGLDKKFTFLKKYSFKIVIVAKKGDKSTTGNDLVNL